MKWVLALAVAALLAGAAPAQATPVQLKVSQRGESTFPEFIEASLRAGVIRYEVDSVVRTCTYFGARGERYVEDYPAVELPASFGVDA